jgi:predicted ABC-type ATPase
MASRKTVAKSARKIIKKGIHSTETVDSSPWLSTEYISKIYNMLSKDVVRTEIPELVILIGPSAVGKSTVKNSISKKSVDIDVDEILIQTTKDFGNPSVFKVIKDYQKFIKMMSDIAITHKNNIILDTTGKMQEAIKYVIHLAKQNGYKITMAFVYSTLDKCEERVVLRKERDNRRRFIPIPAIRKIYDDFITDKIVSFYLIKNKNTFMKKIDNLYIFDNTNDETEIILEKHNNIMQVHRQFPKFYDINIVSVAPFFTIKK